MEVIKVKKGKNSKNRGVYGVIAASFFLAFVILELFILLIPTLVFGILFLTETKKLEKTEADDIITMLLDEQGIKCDEALYPLEKIKQLYVRDKQVVLLMKAGL